MHNGKTPFADGEVLCSEERLRQYLAGLEKSGFPTQFSETGLKNLAARFTLSVEQVHQHIAAHREEAGRHG